MTLQRKIQPEIQPVELSSITEAKLNHLKNGVPVYLINAGSEELMRIEFVFEAGQVRENYPIVASTTNTMLLEGSQNYTANEINHIFDFHGAFINLSIHKDSSSVTVFFLNKHIDKILELCFEVLFRPSFDENDLRNIQKKRLQSYLVNKQKVQNLSTDKFFESVFGPVHPYGKQVFPADFENVTPQMLTDFHDQFYAHGKMAVIVSGNIHKDAITILNNYFGDQELRTELPDIKEFRFNGSQTKKVFVEKKGALQSAIRVGSATINKRHKDYNSLLIFDTVLGGYFGSRLMKNIREDKGYTYGINSSLMSFKQSGYKVIITDVGKKYTMQTLDEIYKEIRLLQTKPVELPELKVARCYMAGEMVRMFDGPFALAESFKTVWEFGLDTSYYYNLSEKIKTIDPDEIMEVANTYYSIDDLYEIVAGA
jgi:zinc protease